MQKAQKLTPLESTQTTVLALTHATSLHRRAWPGPPRGKTATTPLSSLELAGTGAGTWATASAHGTGPPLLPHVYTPVWPTFSLEVGPNES